MKRFRGGLVSQTFVSLNSRLESNKEEDHLGDGGVRGDGRAQVTALDLQRRVNSRSRVIAGRGATRAEDAQGTPTQSHISPSILVYEGYLGDGRVRGDGRAQVPPLGLQRRD